MQHARFTCAQNFFFSFFLWLRSHSWHWANPRRDSSPLPPVTDLNLRDIVVSDAGKPAQLTDLRLVTPASGSAPMVTMVFDSMTPAPARAAQRQPIERLC
jgi:hypothetical protein